MTSVIIFLTSAILLLFFVFVKILESKRQKQIWFTRFLAHQDSWFKGIVYKVVEFLRRTWKRLIIKAKFLIFKLAPFLLKIAFKKFKVFVVLNFKIIKDNIRGKYRKFRSSDRRSRYLEEIYKVKNTDNGRNVEESNTPR